MKTKQTKVTSIKSTKHAASNLHAFRVVVRGTLVKGKKQIRVRKVFTTKAQNEGQAAELAQPRIDKACKDLQNVYMNVFAPLTKAA